MEKRREEEQEVSGAEMKKARAGGRRKAGKEAERREIEKCAGKEKNKCQIKIQSKRTDRYSCPQAETKAELILTSKAANMER